MPPATQAPAAQNSNPRPPMGPLLTARVIHSYMLVIHLALPAILYYMVGRQLDAGALFAVGQIAPAFADSGNVILGALGALTFVAGWLVPGFVAQRVLTRISKPGSQVAAPVLFQAALLPFIVRLSLFEMTTVFGFVIGMRGGVVAAALPFAAAGLAATILSPPSTQFLSGLFGNDSAASGAGVTP